MPVWRVLASPSGPSFGIFCELKKFPVSFVSVAAFFLPYKNMGNEECVNAGLISMKPCNVSRSGNLL